MTYLLLETTFSEWVKQRLQHTGLQIHVHDPGRLPQLILALGQRRHAAQ